MTLMRYHLTHDDDKVINKLLSNESSCLLFNDKHDALFEVTQAIRKKTSNKRFLEKIRTVHKFRTEPTLHKFKIEKSFVVLDFFYQNEFDRDHKMTIDSLQIVSNQLRSKSQRQM